MDTSTFSLDKVRDKLKPIIEHLPFQQLHCFVGNTDFTEVICNHGYRFKVWASHARVPLGLERNSLICGMQLSPLISKSSASNVPRRITKKWLLFERSDAGGLGGIWHLQETSFLRQDGSSVFNSMRTEVDPIDENMEKHLNASYFFPQVVSEGVKKWIEDVNLRRLGIVAVFKAFAESCTPEKLSA